MSEKHVATLTIYEDQDRSARDQTARFSCKSWGIVICPCDETDASPNGSKT